MSIGVPWLTVLTTISRPQYLNDTLNGLDGNGGADTFEGSKILMFDGVQSPFSRYGWQNQQLSPGGEQLKPTRAFIEICRRAVQANCPYILYFEDDVFPCRNAVLAMAKMEVPDGLSFLAFCNQKQGCDYVDKPHIEARRSDAPANDPGHWGCQALKLPRRTLEICSRLSVADDGFMRLYYDVLLGAETASLKSPEHFYGIVLPSLVRHTGIVTTIETQKHMPWEGHRLGLNYAGDDADALEISGAVMEGGVKMWSRNEEVRQ